MTNEIAQQIADAFDGKGWPADTPDAGALLMRAKQEIERLHGCWAEALENVAIRNREIERLRDLMRGWRSYAWKDGTYVDDVQAYFDEHLGGADEPKGFIEVNLYPEPQK